MTFERVKSNLRLTLDIVEYFGKSYLNTSDMVKKLINQAIHQISQLIQTMKKFFRHNNFSKALLLDRADSRYPPE